jgi:N-acetylglucosamine-6-sulfatase
MPCARPRAARSPIAALAASTVALAACVLLGLPGFPGSGPEPAIAAPAAHAAKQCMGADKAQCQSGNARRERLKRLRELNAQQKRPNVIVIETDDQNVTDMFVMQQTLNLLAARGTTFANSYVSYPLCCPSRATFLTGQYAHNHGVTTDSLPNAFGALDNWNTLAVWLRQAKYRTAMVGKYLNGYGVGNLRFVPPGWSQWFALTGGTDQKRYRYNLNENGKVHYYKNGPRNYVTDVLSSKVNMLLKQWTISPKPFFLWFTPTAPHGERAVPVWSTRDPEPAPRHLGVFGDIGAPEPPNFNEADVSDKPQQIRDLPLLGSTELADLDRRYRGRLESLLSVDDEVKKIVGLIRKYGDKRKTFIFFTSDNGLEMGAHRIEFKDYLYEEGERVPLIIRGPGFPAGVTRQQLVANIDLAPTIAALTKAHPARIMDGVDLLPLAQNPSAFANRDILFESYDIAAFGIRSGPWVYNSYSNGDEELYNLISDPYELQSQDENPADAMIKAQLAAKLAQLRTCVGPTCR